MHTNSRASGQVLPVFALLLTALIGMCAIAIDASNLYSQHRRLQADLDVAVRVASADMFVASPSASNYASTTASAFSAAATILAQDGYPNALMGITSTASLRPNGVGYCASDAAAGITFCSPPTSGIYAGQSNYLEGRLNRTIKGYFGAAIGLDRLPVAVRATATHGGFSEPYAIIGLQPGPNCSIYANDTTTTVVVTGSLFSNGAACMKANASPLVHGTSNFVVDATTLGGNPSNIAGTGGTIQASATITDPFPAVPFTGTVAPYTVCQSGCTAASFADLLALGGPDCTATANSLFGSLTVPPNTTFFIPPSGSTVPSLLSVARITGGTYDLMPQCAPGNPAVPGVYALSGTLDMSGGAALNSFNSVLVMSDTASPLSKMNGHGTVVLNAPQSGPYQGIAITEQPCSPSFNGSNPNLLDLTGTSGSLINGAIDAPCANINLGGTSGNEVLTGVVVGWTVQFSGNTTLNLIYDNNNAPQLEGSHLVE